MKKCIRYVERERRDIRQNVRETMIATKKKTLAHRKKEKGQMWLKVTVNMRERERDSRERERERER